MNQGEFRITPAEQEIIELYVENNAKIVLNSYVDRSSAKRARFMNLKKHTQNIIDYFEFAKKECEEYSSMYQGFDATVYAKSILQKLNGVESEIPINVTFDDHWKQLTQLRKEYVKNAAAAKQKNEPEFEKLSQVVSIERLNELNNSLERKRVIASTPNKTRSGKKRGSEGLQNDFEQLYENASKELNRLKTKDPI